jgi:hypothetical protein
MKMAQSRKLRCRRSDSFLSSSTSLFLTGAKFWPIGPPWANQLAISGFLDLEAEGSAASPRSVPQTKAGSDAILDQWP